MGCPLPAPRLFAEVLLRWNIHSGHRLGGGASESDPVSQVTQHLQLTTGVTVRQGWVAPRR